MSGFRELRFSDRIAHGATGGPRFRTSIVEVASGHEQRNIDWSAARGRWNVGSGLKSRDDVAELIAFYRVMRGRAYGFRFKDWSDYRAEGMELGLGDGVRQVFQLVKHYAAGGFLYDREITKPVPGSLTVRLNGVTQGSGWTLDASSGLLSWAIAPPVGQLVSADFQFDVPVRFDTDEMRLDLAYHDLSEWADIPIVEIRV